MCVQLSELGCAFAPSTYYEARDRKPSARALRLLEVIEGRSGAVLAGWLCERDLDWRAGVQTASLDPFRGYATALATQLPGATRVLSGSGGALPRRRPLRTGHASFPAPRLKQATWASRA